MTNADKFKHLFGIYATELWSMPESDFLEWLNADAQDMPTVERKTGRWETAMLDHEAFGVRPKVLYCSECNQCIAYPTRYCPSCGAKMEVEHESDCW